MDRATTVEPTDLTSLDALAAAWRSLPKADHSASLAAQERQSRLTKPEGSLGELEQLAAWYAGWRGAETIRTPVCQTAIFAGNHGVAARNVSPFPADVTAQMVANFQAGGAAANQLSKLHGANFSVTPIALDRPTRDFVSGPAQELSEFLDAVRRGAETVSQGTDILVIGEMGIGNTTSASALCTLLYGGDPRAWTGAGAGLDPDGFERKALVVANGVNRHVEEITLQPEMLRPLEALRRVGGREMAAILGALLAARRQNTVVLLDGFIVSAVAAVAAELAPEALDHCVAGHCSAESAHTRLLIKLGKRPLLDLGMRLGEGSGALVALGILRAAIACHSGMATFEEAGVSGKDA